MSDIDHPQHQLALEQGRDDGRRAGRMAGFEEGRALGQTKGVEYGMEVGFALGLVEAVQQWHQPQQQQQQHQTDGDFVGSSTSTSTISAKRILPTASSRKEEDGEAMNNMHSSGIIHFNDRIQRSIDELARAIRNFPIKAEDILAMHHDPTDGPPFDAEGRDGREKGIVDGDGDKEGHNPFTMTELSCVSHASNKMDLQDQLQQIRARSKVMLAKLGLPHHSLTQIMQQAHLPPQDKVSSTSSSSSSSNPTTLDIQKDETTFPKTTSPPASATMNEW